MSGALLFGLQLEADAVMRHGRFDFCRLMAGDDDDALGRRKGAGGADDVLDERRSCSAVQDLGEGRFHARAEAGREDDHRDVGRHGGEGNSSPAV